MSRSDREGCNILPSPVGQADILSKERWKQLSPLEQKTIVGQVRPTDPLGQMIRSRQLLAPPPELSNPCRERIVAIFNSCLRADIVEFILTIVPSFNICIPHFLDLLTLNEQYCYKSLHYPCVIQV